MNQARFSSPLLQRDGPPDQDSAVFWCRSSGGFPKPIVSWLINETEQPPEDSVWTQVAPVPDNNLYNVTSKLTVNISSDDSVSCSIMNQWMNETLTSRSSGVTDNTFRSRASEGMWMFSTGLCVAVGIMVGAGVAYQIHLDRIIRKKHKFLEETEEEMLTSKETSV
uniref:Ig-like domain-containing protein n=1 Tax=Knipowitschia caucasica TaxID=637954 RepID=A0AAV2L1V1_KNICA